MNRIRKHGNKFQVLITPTQMYNPQFEILVGGWTDEYLRNFYIAEYDTMGEAQCEAFKHPDIDWEKMVLMQKNAFHDIKNLLQENINKHKFIVDFIPQYMDQYAIKNNMFNRVMQHGNRFTLAYHMNDVISYHIISPWSKNLLEIADKLNADPKLKLFKRYNSNGVIHLIGKTDLGTTYEIGLWPTIISQWARWVQEHPNVSQETKKQTFQEAVSKQSEIDAGFSLR
jgi:hypothetical protein